MALQSGAQIIIQIERADGRFDCLGFAGIPVVNPVFIALARAHTPEAATDLNDLRGELLRELSILAPHIQPVPLPCGGMAPGPDSCHAQQDPDCQKLLVLVGDNVQPLVQEPFHQHWISGSTNFHVLPIFRNAARTSVWNLLPPSYRHVNVEFWDRSISEAIPAILGLSNITVENPRIFISYRQKDAPALAIQVFDALSHYGFDTFLDHFRIPPGVNFQARLTQELGNKSMVLLIESQHILDSEWTTYEIGVAKTCSLGLFAVQIPGGPSVAGIDPAIRMKLSNGQFKGGAFSSAAELDTATLQAVVDRIKVEHDRALVRRRQILRDSLEGALLEQGVGPSVLSSRGTLQVRSHSGIEYIVWLTPRPPELPDFHVVHGQANHPQKGVVVGLSRLMEPLRLSQTGWLANLSQITLIDEGHLKLAAAEMANGLL